MSNGQTDNGGSGAGLSTSLSKALLSDLRSRLWARAENAYCEMISVTRRDESLGWEIKVERGEFGRKELDAHRKAGELLGRHRALAEACREIDDVLEAEQGVIQQPMMSIPTWLFPTILIVLDLCAAWVWAAQGDWRKAVYWVAAAVLTATIMYKKGSHDKTGPDLRAMRAADVVHGVYAIDRR